MPSLGITHLTLRYCVTKKRLENHLALEHGYANPSVQTMLCSIPFTLCISVSLLFSLYYYHHYTIDHYLQEWRVGKRP